MSSLFKSKPKALVGVDIGSSYIKLLGLSRHSKGFRVDSYAITHLPDGAVIDNNVQEVPIVADAIKRAIKVANVKTKLAATSVPASGVITKNLEFSNSFTEDELEDQIQVEADQYIPYPLDEVAIDFQVLGPVEDDKNLNQVILVACRQDSVQSREDSVNGAGLDCDVIDVDTFALERVYEHLIGPHDLDGKTVGMVEIGASSMSLYVFEDGVVTYNREQVFGGNDLSISISQISDMSLDEVEHAKKSGSLPDDIQQNYVEPFKQTAAQQISRALQFYYSSGSHSELDAILLAGGTSGLAGIAEVVEQELGITTQVANPFANMQFGSKINPNKFQSDASSLVLACGLALRSFAE